MLASLLRDQRQFAEAARILHELVGIYWGLKEAEKLASLLVRLANVHAEAQEPKAAIQVFSMALPFIPEGDPLLLSVIQGMALSLVDAGAPEAAETVLEGTRWLYREAGKLNEIRHHWLEGKIAAALDQPGKAEARLNLAREEFLREKQTFDSALVSLDLALLLLGQERRKELAYVAEQMLATFRRLGIARESLATLILLRNSCETGSQDLLRGYIEALARTLPELERKSKRKRRS